MIMSLLAFAGLLAGAGIGRAADPLVEELLHPASTAGERIEFLVDTAQRKAFVRDMAAVGTWFAAYAGGDESHQQFARGVRSHVDPDPIKLLQRQRELYKRVGYDDMLPRFDAILAGRLGRVVPIRRAEAALFLAHRRWFGDQSEFETFVLTNGNRLRLYYSGGPEMSPPPSDDVQARLRTDRSQGWTVVLHLHNHPFMFDNPTGDIAGTTIPSGTRDYGDVSVYLKFRTSLAMKGAAVTNGFSTILVKAEEFDRLDQRPEGDLPRQLVRHLFLEEETR